MVALFRTDTLTPVVTSDAAVVATWVRDRIRGEPIFFDTETTGLGMFSNKLVAVQLYQTDQSVLIIDMRRAYHIRVAEALAPLFDNPPLFVGANIKFDYGFTLENLGHRMTRLYDVMIAEQVLNGVGRSGARAAGVALSLEGICNHRGIPISKQERNWFIDLDKRESEWNAPFPGEQIEYMAHDVTVLETIYNQQLEELRAKKLIPVMRLEMDALPAFGEMEHNGIKVDVDGWRAFIAKKQAEAETMENGLILKLGPLIVADRIIKYDADKAAYDQWAAARDEVLARLQQWWSAHDDEPGYESGWGDFKNRGMKEWRAENPNPGNPKMDTSLPNIGSSVQLMIAFNALGIPAKNTSEEVLKELRDEFPIVGELLAWRKSNKFVESFGETLLAKISPVTGRIHPDIVPIGADTGRSSVTNPNTQQWPSRGADGKELRSLVIPEAYNVFVVNDYPNIELRIFAYMSGCQRMLGAFANGEDLHTVTARAMFGLSDDIDVKHTVAVDRNGRVLNGWTYRDIGKTTNFGIIYGMGVPKLARTLNTTTEEGSRLMTGYYEMYPEVKTFQAKMKEEALSNGVTRTLSGRPHYYIKPMLPVWTGDRAGYHAARSEYRKTLSMFERMACNYPIQGTSADITKKALGLLFRRIDPNVVKMVLVVHDEIVLECPEAMGKEVATILEECMTQSCAVYMPDFPVDCRGANIAKTWSKE